MKREIQKYDLLKKSKKHFVKLTVCLCILFLLQVQMTFIEKKPNLMMKYNKMSVM